MVESLIRHYGPAIASYLGYVISISIFMWIPHTRTQAAVLSFFAFCTAAYVGFPMPFVLLNDGRYHKASWMRWKLYFTLSFMTLLGVWFGQWNYEYYYARYIDLKNSHAFTNILPANPALHYSDGGIFVFSTDSKVDASRQVGYRPGDGNTYCAAPVLQASTDEVVAPVTFWAVGMNCCSFDERQPMNNQFMCMNPTTSENLTSDKARSGIKYQFDTDDEEQMMLRAVRKGIASNEFPDVVFSTIRGDDGKMENSDRIVLLQWSVDPAADRDWFYNEHSLSYTFYVLFGLFVVFALFAAQGFADEISTW